MTTHRPSGLASLVAALALLAAACGGKAPEVAPTPEPEPVAAVAATPGMPRASVCAPTGLITDNMRARFADLFTASDAVSVRRRKGMRIAKLSAAPVTTVGDDRVCARAVRTLAGREPAAAAALGDAPRAASAETQGMARAGSSGRPRNARPAAAGRAATSGERPVKPAMGGVLALVKVGPYYLVQDASARPNEGAGATYVLDGAMRVKGVIQ